MGITSELVKNAFSKNRSFGTTHDPNMMRVERKRWASVRSYLCGDEFNSVLAEKDYSDSGCEQDYCDSARTSKATVFSSRIDDDSASVKGSEATVTQPISENSNDAREKTKLTSENEAAIVIQSAFRSFLARRERIEGSDRESIATSVRVQTGMSVKNDGESFTPRTQHHKSARVQPLKLKQEGWDDSTVSSNISKMRIQNRLEASTRRERALAYAFSQQLRICSKKKLRARPGNDREANMSWSWLERWMATRQHDTSFGDISKQFEQLNVSQKLMVKSKVISDLAGEEKESCGSNDVSLHFDNVSLSSKIAEKSCDKPVKNRVKGARDLRQRKLPRYAVSPRSATR